MAHAAIHLIIPTYSRDDALAQMLVAVSKQTYLANNVYVIDNASSPDTKRVCTDANGILEPTIIHYVDAGSNLGPAGATCLGMELAIDVAGDGDWVMRADDDSVFPSTRTFEVLIELGEKLRETDPFVGGLGLGGALWDRKKLRLVKPPTGERGSVVPVDYLATGHFAMFAVTAVKDCGPFRADLFFGHSEVEYGLRLRRCGWNLYRKDLPYQTAGSQVADHSSRYRLAPATWRRYYSARNLLVISAEYEPLYRAVILGIARLLAKPLILFPLQPKLAIQNLQLGILAMLHAYKGRMGRTVEPTTVAGILDSRGREAGTPFWQQ